MPKVPSGCRMPNTDAGLPFTSMLRRSIRNTVGCALVPPARVWGAVCERASVLAVEAARAESRSARRESMGQPLSRNAASRRRMSEAYNLDASP
jgi:hypothetical protein